MLESLHSFFASPGFIFVAGMLLLATFFWYLAAESDRVKRISGTIFVLGLSTFSIISLVNNGVKYGIDISGGVELTLQVQPRLSDSGQLTPPSPSDMQQASDILNERLNSTGTSEVQIIHTNDKILIQIPQQDRDAESNKKKLDAMVNMLTKMAKLELLPVHPDSHSILANLEVQNAIAAYEDRKDIYNAEMAKNRELNSRPPALPRIPGSMGFNDYMIVEHPSIDKDGAPVRNRAGKEVINYLVILKPYAAMQKDIYITGKDVVDSRANSTRKGCVSVVLSSEGAEKMTRATLPMVKRVDRLAVVLNNVVKCAPSVNQTLRKEFEISGLDAPGEAEDIAKSLANPLSSDLKVEGRKDVSAQLGKSALEQGKIAGLIGAFGVFGFCFWYYRIAGFVAMIGLSFNMLILLGMMSLFGFVLTLPGIAGIVLTMGIAVDANVLIYERMREELKEGRTFAVSLRNAYNKAFSAIFDSNVTSLLTAAILFAMASGSIKGFAVTTCVGIATTLIGAIVVTRVLFFWFDRLGFVRNIKFSKPPLEDSHFDFLGNRRLAGSISCAVILICAVYAFGFRQDKALGIDFTGGATMTYVIDQESKLDYPKLEEEVKTMDLAKKASSQEFNSASGRSITIRCSSVDEADFIDASLREKFPNMKQVGSPSVAEVSASLGSTFFNTALLALGVGMLGITFYLAMRFEWSFAMGAFVSIIHDVAIVIGLTILFGMELNVIHIGAFLTVVGYSINDTIVIYDRIREDIRTQEPHETLSGIMNKAINDTLPRTLLTGLSTIAVLISLLAFGGSSMYDFALTMLIGVIVGTYSSVYIAAPVTLYFARKHNLREELLAADKAEDETNESV